MPSEPIYYVDYIYDGCDIDINNILDIARLEDLWGKDIDEPYIAIHNLKIDKSMLTLMSPDKKPTLKINIQNKLSIIKFNSNEEEYESLLSDGYVAIDIIGRCNINNWLGNEYPQIIVEDYKIIEKCKYCF